MVPPASLHPSPSASPHSAPLAPHIPLVLAPPPHVDVDIYAYIVGGVVKDVIKKVGI